MRPIALRDNSTGRGLILVSLALLALGVVMVHSAVASVAQPGEWYKRVDVRHTAFAGLAVVVLLTAWRVGYGWLNAGRRLPIPAAVLLGVALVCGGLVFVPGFGHAVGGRWRWLRIMIGPASITFQPSEFIKVAMVIFLAAWLSRERTDRRGELGAFLLAIVVILVCVGAVIGQDFGAGVLMAIIGGCVLLLAGAPWSLLLSLGALASGGGYLLLAGSPHRWARIAATSSLWIRLLKRTGSGAQP